MTESEKVGDRLRRERRERERLARILGGPVQPAPSRPTAEWVERYGRY